MALLRISRVSLEMEDRDLATGKSRVADAKVNEHKKLMAFCPKET